MRDERGCVECSDISMIASPKPESIAAPTRPDSAAPLSGPTDAPITEIAAAHRVLGFDLVRAAAATSVIWVHIGRSAEWREHNLTAAGSWGTAFLNSLAGFFVVWALTKRGALSAPRFALHRIWRLYGSFLIWCGIYLFARVVNYAAFGKVSSLALPGQGLSGWERLRACLSEAGIVAFFGTTYHLWFLPYLLIITLLTLPLVVLSVRSRAAMLNGATLFALATLVLLLAPEPWWVAASDLRYIALSHIYLRSPGYLTGLAFGLWIAAGFRPRVTMHTALACIGLVALAMYLSLTTELPRHLLNRAGATAAFIVAFAPWRGRVATAIGRVGRLGFGVYLCHVLFIEGYYACAHAMHMPPNLTVDLSVFGLSVISSFGAAYALSRVRWLAWTIP
jgi:peptidoglycan/LPS O-acetylase OafA/YrhL